MNRPIPTSVHGVLDYLSVPTLIALPRALKWSRNLTNILTGVALGTLGTSIMTRYELGLFKVLPMKTHLALDMGVAATIAAAPFIIPDKQPRQGTVTGILLGLGIFELTAALLTKTHSPVESEDQSIGETISDLKDTVQEKIHIGS